MEIREQLLCGSVTSIPIPIGTVCKLCNDKEAIILCKECGSQGYFCERCALSLHAQINIFHIPIIQKVASYLINVLAYTISTYI